MTKTFHTKKSLGQHFLKDTSVINKMIASINPKKDQKFIEIGPGQGALTSALLPYVKSIDAIEFDKTVIPYLKSFCEGLGELNIHIEDILQFNFEDKFQNTEVFKVVGNLPYNISTPIFFHLLKYLDQIQTMCLMVQKEVAERVCAVPGTKAYGRLSVMIQYHCQTTLLFNVPPQAFSPPPKVDSAVMMLKPYLRKPYQALDEALLSELVRDCFNMRRKVLRNSVKKYINIYSSLALPVDLGLRPENLTVEDFVLLANFIHKQRHCYT